MNHYVTITHNMEIAHRLSNLPGKCQNIHGHSMIVSLTLYGNLDENGIFEGADYGTLKKFFRQHLDTNYDHHLLLNENDPWAGLLLPEYFQVDSGGQRTEEAQQLPGLVKCPGDPTTENLSMWICNWAHSEFGFTCEVTITETGSNAAGYRRP